MNTDKILSIPAEEYHAESRNGHYMSSHLLADFRESPELYHRKVTGEIAATESPALALGRAAHCLILEGRMAFDEQYLVSDGPVNAKTGEAFGKTTKSYSDWLAAQTKEVLSCRDYGFITKLQKSVWMHDIAGQLLDKGSPEGVIRAEYCGVPCQIRMDWFSPEYGLVDLKTCDSLKWFENDCRRYGYLYQMAFYHAVIEQALDVSVPAHIIAVEKNEPFSTGVWELSPSVLEEAKLAGIARQPLLFPKTGKAARFEEYPPKYSFSSASVRTFNFLCLDGGFFCAQNHFFSKTFRHF